ncbi:hypothetical protein BCD67_01285 [Oscillatoriales cyanobacterium USR001]|nr:hypothetical protein BCD67_01285 [Oscillatoriales cyanobacterium USR001]
MALAHKDLLRQLDSLSASFPTLGSRLSQAAKELQEGGTPLSDGLLEEVVGYCQSFAIARNQALELGKSLRQSSATVSLQNIRDLVKAVEAVEGNAETRQQVLSLLDRLLGIVHQEQSNFAPLQLVYEQAKELQRSLSQAAAELPESAIALAEGKHPLFALLTLVEQGKNLDDSQWETLEESVEKAFGKPLVVPIRRGKLVINAIATKTNLAIPSAQPETNFSLPITPPKVTAEALPEVIIIPSVSATTSKTIKVDPEITILESPASVPIHEVIVVPSVEVTPPLKAIAGQDIVFGQAQSVGSQTPVKLKVLAHIQSIGDRTFAAQEYAGTRGKNLRLEGFGINIEPAIPGLSIQYMAHVEGVGDTAWLNEGELAGFRGKAKRIEGFAIRLIGPQAANYNVFYAAHIQNIGDVPTVSNGQYCGTRGKSLRIEGIKIWVEPSKNAVVAQAQPPANVGLKVLAHIQSVGDRIFKAKEDAGSRGKSLRLEGFQIEIEPPIPGLSIQYMAHVEGVGDTSWLNQGEFAGFRGKSKRIEGLAIRLVGPQADKYDVFYSAHVQNIGDISPVANGQYCGTRGKALRVESMKVWIQAK